MPTDDRIDIRRLSQGTYEVSVSAEAATVHTVTLSDSACRELTGGTLEPEALIQFSFSFLLEREPNTSILRQFDLIVIERYFPEYREAVDDWSATT